MNILVDANFAYAKALFSELGELNFYSSRQPNEEQLQKADVLLVRSTTQVNESLLAQAPELKFIGSATIGTDHIDLSALESKGITFAHAPGCNANAVKEYVLSSLSIWLQQKQLNREALSMSVIGYGNVGSKVAEAAASLGMTVKAVDPFKTIKPLETIKLGHNISQVDFEAALDSDIISLHVPLTKSGEYPTYHMFNEDSLKQFSGRLLINTCRGSVISQKALMPHLQHNDFEAVLDVWENEPDINLELLEKVWLATPHIAGYSLEGKAKGSLQVYQAMMQFLNKTNDITLAELLPKLTPISTSTEDWQTALLSVYNPIDDDTCLREGVLVMPEHFDSLRRNYQLRRELKSYLLNEPMAANAWLSAIQV